MENKESYCATGTGSCCGCMCHKVMGVLIMLIGLVFLLQTFGVVSPRFVAITWPILLILIGFKKSFLKGRCKCCSSVQK